MVIELPDDYLYLVGDTHSIEKFNQLLDKIPRDSTIFHVGDCGIGRNPTRQFKKLSRHAGIRNQKILLIRGNHDNPHCFPSKIGNVRLLEDYTKLKFANGTTALCVGGAISVDRTTSVLDYDYWTDEVTVFDPNKCEKVDFIFMHDAPSYFNNPTYTLPSGFFGRYVQRDATLMEDSYKQRQVIDMIVDACKPTYIYGGHYHNNVHDRINDLTYRCLNINEIYMFSADIAHREA